MNKDLILKVADAIENESIAGLKYDQDTFCGDCGTRSCIAGWAWCLAHHENKLPIDMDKDTLLYKAKYLFELTWNQAFDLMLHSSVVPIDPDGELRPVTRAEAAATLRRLAKTGRVEWVRS